MEILSGYTITAVFARIVLRAVLARHAKPEALFRGTRLNGDALWKTDRISLADFRVILKNAETLVPELPAGFLIGRAHHLSTLGSLGAAVGAAPSLRSGFQVLQAFTRLQVSYLRLDLESRPEGFALALRFLADMGVAEVAHAEATMAFLLRHAELVSGLSLEEARLCFAYLRPHYAELYADEFPCVFSFGGERSELILPASCIDVPSPYFNEQLWLQAQEDLAAQLRLQADTTGASYRTHLASYLASLEPPLPGISQIAGELRVSDRTLHRRLREEGTSYRELRGQVLMENAKRRLAHSRDSVESIARSLGFHDAANFRRAFRKATGESPSAYRSNTSTEAPRH